MKKIKYVDPYLLKRYPTIGGELISKFALSSYRMPYVTLNELNERREGEYILFCAGNIQFIGNASNLHTSVSALCRKYYFEEIAFVPENFSLPIEMYLIYKKYGGKTISINFKKHKEKFQLAKLGYTY